MKNKLFAVLLAILSWVVICTLVHADSTNWSKPSTSDTYSAWPGYVKDLARTAGMMDYTGDTNIPTNVIRYNRTTKQFEKYNGTTWDAQTITNLEDGAVSSSAKMGTGVVTSTNILDGTIANGDIANSTIQSGKIADDAITTAKLATNSVTTLKIDNGTIVNADIASGTIQRDKLDGNEAWIDISSSISVLGTGTYSPSSPTVTYAKFAAWGRVTSFRISANWSSASGSGRPLLRYTSSTYSSTLNTSTANPLTCIITTSSTSDQAGIGYFFQDSNNPNGAVVVNLSGGSNVSFGTGFSSINCAGTFERF